jgi:hypothetical protein
VKIPSHDTEICGLLEVAFATCVGHIERWAQHCLDGGSPDTAYVGLCIWIQRADFIAVARDRLFTVELRARPK